MGMGFAPTWLHQVSPPLLNKTTLTTAYTTDDILFMDQIIFNYVKNTNHLREDENLMAACFQLRQQLVDQHQFAR